MMFMLYKLAGSLIIPPGIFCLMLLLCSFLAAKKPRKIYLAAALALLSILLWFMSIPPGAALITGPLEKMYPDRLPPENTKAAVLVLSGGSSYDYRGDAVQPAVYALERMYRGVLLAKKQAAPLYCQAAMSLASTSGQKPRSCQTAQEVWGGKVKAFLKRNPGPLWKTLNYLPIL